MRNKITLGLALSLLALSYANAEDTLTISTYYPSPYGAYNQLQTNRLAVGDTNNNGGLDAGDQPSVNGQIYAARSVIYKPQNSLPSSGALKGEVVYNNSDNNFYYYNGNSWVKQGASGPANWTCTLRTGAPARCVAPEKPISYFCLDKSSHISWMSAEDPPTVNCYNSSTWQSTAAVIYCCK